MALPDPNAVDGPFANPFDGPPKYFEDDGPAGEEDGGTRIGELGDEEPEGRKGSVPGADVGLVLRALSAANASYISANDSSDQRGQR